MALADSGVNLPPAFSCQTPSHPISAPRPGPTRPGPLNAPSPTPANPGDRRGWAEKAIPCYQPDRAIGLSAAVYTQTNDVESEVNGFFTNDRRFEKIKPEALAELNHAVCETKP